MCDWESGSLAAVRCSPLSLSLSLSCSLSLTLSLSLSLVLSYEPSCQGHMMVGTVREDDWGKR